MWASLHSNLTRTVSDNLHIMERPEVMLFAPFAHTEELTRVPLMVPFQLEPACWLRQQTLEPRGWMTLVDPPL